MVCGLPGSSVHTILQTRILEWVAMPSSGALFYPGIEPVALMYPTLAGRFFTTSVPGRPCNCWQSVLFILLLFPFSWLTINDCKYHLTDFTIITFSILSSFFPPSTLPFTVLFFSLLNWLAINQLFMWSEPSNDYFFQWGVWIFTNFGTMLYFHTIWSLKYL